MATNKILMVQSVPVTVLHQSDADFISLTDMVRQAKMARLLLTTGCAIRNTLEFLSVWDRNLQPGF